MTRASAPPSSSPSPAPSVAARDPGPPRRSRCDRPRALAGLAVRAMGPGLGRRGLAEEALLTHWADIMGPVLAARVHPVRLARPRGEQGGVLHVIAESGAVAFELQYLEPQVIERVNGYLGRPAVARLAVRQGRGRRGASRRAQELPPLPPARREALETALAAVDDSPLREALRRLGEAIGRREAGRGG
ncbi:DUF721 domain-containing protein [Pararhodospirillum oryzae]|uniref:DUF721 domain-containing protein n=1 Tax=Pararhodospirillum oryzae TaxID=478448 RepID=A0A512H9X6_9PROT|nr:DciA family protein [Pararhodospirillum oryzae]GEO82253.1 hypothetical protein ROR02_23840 [Pararhodospirillum oryzae]